MWLQPTVGGAGGGYSLLWVELGVWLQPAVGGAGGGYSLLWVELGVWLINV